MFSEKYGYKPEKTIQHECISDELRCRVWNLFSQQEIKAGGLASKRLSQAMNGEPTIEEKIVDRMGFLIDPTTKDLSAEAQLKNKILRFFSWFEVYDMAPAVIGIIKIRIDKVHEWMGNGELLTQNNLFPPPAYDYGFDLLLSRDDLFKDSEYSIAKYV